MNDGAKPRLTNANAPFFRNTRRDIMRDLSVELTMLGSDNLQISSSLKLWRAERERQRLRRVGRLRNRRARRLGHVAAEQTDGVD